MMIKFTNSYPDYRGNPIYINSDHITSVFEKQSVKDGSYETKIFGVQGTEWTVEESLNQVIKLINAHTTLLTEQ